MRIGIGELRAAAAAANRIEKDIAKEYPLYEGWLVFSTRVGQIDVGASIEEIFKRFPQMVVDDPRKTECQVLLRTIKGLEDSADAMRGPGREAQRTVAKAKLDELRKEFSLATEQLEFDPDVQIEIRFKVLKYQQVVYPLQQDSLIDQTRTPQTHASIRIVIGTIGKLGRQ